MVLRGSGQPDRELGALVAELRRIAKLDWDEPDGFDFEELQTVAELAALPPGASGGPAVERLRGHLTSLVTELKAEEEARDAPEYRRLSDAADALLMLDDGWRGHTLEQRRDWLLERWAKLEKGVRKPIASVGSFAKHQEPKIYERLASRLLRPIEDVAEAAQPSQRPAKRKMPPVPPAPWPVEDHQPSADQEIVLLIATRAMRDGPASGLVKLVREFEPYWRSTRPIIHALEGSYRAIWRAGLLHDYEGFVCLPAGFYGGLVYATDIVIAARQADPRVTAHVVYLIDPHDNSSLYPATASIKRECLLTGTPFLTTYRGAARWFRLEWAHHVAEVGASESREFLLERPKSGFPAGSGLDDPPGTLALAAHARHKRAMMEFADGSANLLNHHFSKRYATRVTGHLLNGGSINDPTDAPDERTYADEIALYDVRDVDRADLLGQIAAKSEAWAAKEREGLPGAIGWVDQLTRGREGGVIQLARKVLEGDCNTVVFFQDAETPREHDMEIQVLDRAAQLPGVNCLLLYDEESAARWAENVAVCLDRDRVPSASTLIDAYRHVFATEEQPDGVELVLGYREAEPRRRGPHARPRKQDTAAIWRQIIGTAATYLVGTLRAAAARREGRHEPVRFAFPWGGAIRDIIGEIGDAGARSGLSGALGLQEFADRRECTELSNDRRAAKSARKWPPIPENPKPYGAGELRVIPTVGLVGAKDRSLESHALVQRAVNVLGGQPVRYAESAFLFTGGRENPLGEDAPHEDWKKTDLLLLTAAPVRPRPRQGVLATGLPSDLAQRFKGAEGAVSTLYLEKTRNEVREAKHEGYMQTGISLEQIRKLVRADQSEVVLVTGAEMERVRPAWAALKAGLASTFVTDPAFAWEVLRKELPKLPPPSQGR